MVINYGERWGGGGANEVLPLPKKKGGGGGGGGASFSHPESELNGEGGMGRALQFLG